jgi:CheY-like chemotaxis protein
MVQEHVLLVDDSRDQNWLHAALFRSIGCSVSVASNAAEAVQSCRSHRPDILVVDYSMPDGNGIDLVKNLRPILNDHVYCVVLTGHDLSEVGLAQNVPGIARVLQKPLTHAQIAGVLSGFSDHMNAH